MFDRRVRTVIRGFGHLFKCLGTGEPYVMPISSYAIVLIVCDLV